jgi:CYTH domain-containing protein
MIYQLGSILTNLPASNLPNGANFGKNKTMPTLHKYARIERERRFLLKHFPSDANRVRVRRITDRYIDGTNLRLREQNDDGGPAMFKLTQKLPARASGAQQGLITSMYLSRDEHLVLARLPARQLTKTRHSVPPFGIDVFEGKLEGLLLAEAEFDSAEAADQLTIPSFVHAEVSTDDRFTGGQLVSASRRELQAWLLEYGVTLMSS